MINVQTRIKLENPPSFAAELAAAELEGSLGHDSRDLMAVISTENRYSEEKIKTTLRRFGLKLSSVYSE